jgi:acyl carrier protein
LDDIQKIIPPLRGVFHLAAVIEPGLLTDLDAGAFERVVRAKASSAWNLHTCTGHLALDYFVMFSSVASLFGTAGQGNYAMANAFLDGLAAYRASQGLPALSVNWGTWVETGLVKQNDGMEFFAQRGFLGIHTDAGLLALSHAMQASKQQVAIMPVDWRQVQAVFPDLLDQPWMMNITRELDSGRAVRLSALGARIRSLDVIEAGELLTGYLKHQLSLTLAVDDDGLDENIALVNMGVDSLMALELKNRMEKELAISIPVVTLIEGVTLNQLRDRIMDQLTSKHVEPVGQVEIEVRASGSKSNNMAHDTALMLERMEKMSEEELDSLLATLEDDD